MEDSRIIDLLFERNQSGISEITLKYGKLLFRTSDNILHCKEDARECVNDTYLAAWNTIPPNKPNPLTSFLCRIVRNLSLKKLRDKTTLKRNAITVPLDELAEAIGVDEAFEKSNDAKMLGEAIDRFLDSIDKESRVVFVRRYWFCDEIAEISSQTGIAESNVYQKLSRTRKRLKAFLEKEGVKV